MIQFASFSICIYVVCKPYLPLLCSPLSFFLSTFFSTMLDKVSWFSLGTYINLVWLNLMENLVRQQFCIWENLMKIVLLTEENRVTLRQCVRVIINKKIMKERQRRKKMAVSLNKWTDFNQFIDIDSFCCVIWWKILQS